MTPDDLLLVHDLETGAPTVFVGPVAYMDNTSLLAAHPTLLSGGDSETQALALALNHFARGTDYEVILDPEAFEARYRATVATEPVDGEWSQGQVRLRDFGQPDFSQIHPPYLAGDVITFFARDAFTGLAYSANSPVEAPQDAAYTPAPLTPIDA
jgi:hypothetical protein